MKLKFQAIIRLLFSSSFVVIVARQKQKETMCEMVYDCSIDDMKKSNELLSATLKEEINHAGNTEFKQT